MFGIKTLREGLSAFLGAFLL